MKPTPSGEDPHTVTGNKTGGERLLAAPRRLLGILLAGWAPLALSVLVKTIAWPRPFWIRYYDPEQIYFYGGRRLLHGELPINLDNPGIPAHLISAGLQALLGSDPFRIDGVRLAAYAVGLALALVAAWILLSSVLSELSPTLQVVGLWLYLLPAAALRYSTIWSPELFYPLFGALALSLVFRAARSQFEPFSVLLAGFGIGIAISLKFTFLPWLVAYLIWVALYGGASFRSRAVAVALGVAGAQSGFVSATWFVARKYWEMGLWVWGLVSRSGRYATGTTSLPDPRALVRSLAAGLLADPIWLVALLGLGTISAVALRDRAWGGEDPSSRRLAVFAWMCFGASLLSSARHFSDHYFLPPALAAAAWLPPLGYLTRGARGTRIQQIVIATVSGLLALRIGFDLAEHRRLIADWEGRRERIETRVAEVGRELGRPPVVVYGFYSPSLSFALRPMAEDVEVNRELARRFPHDGYISYGGDIVLPPGASSWDLALVWEAGLDSFRGDLGPAIDRLPGLVLFRPRGSESALPASR